jgi:hypothetical protein
MAWHDDAQPHHHRCLRMEALVYTRSPAQRSIINPVEEALRAIVCVHCHWQWKAATLPSFPGVIRNMLQGEFTIATMILLKAGCCQGLSGSPLRQAACPTVDGFLVKTFALKLVTVRDPLRGLIL